MLTVLALALLDQVLVLDVLVASLAVEPGSGSQGDFNFKVFHKIYLKQPEGPLCPTTQYRFIISNIPCLDWLPASTC